MKIKSLVNYGLAILGFQAGTFLAILISYLDKELYLFMTLSELAILLGIFLIHLGLTGGLKNNDN
jgi:uncharacterized membrane protein